LKINGFKVKFLRNQSEIFAENNADLEVDKFAKQMLSLFSLKHGGVKVEWIKHNCGCL